MKLYFSKEDVLKIISLMQAITDGKTLQASNGNGGWVDVLEPTVNDIILYFNTYRIKHDDSIPSKYNIKLSAEEIDVIKTSIDAMLLAKVNGKAKKLCGNILDGIDRLNCIESVNVPMFEHCPDVLCEDCNIECEMKKIMKKAETNTTEELEKEIKCNYNQVFKDWWFRKFGVKLEDDINQHLTSEEANELCIHSFDKGYNLGYRNAMTINTDIDNAIKQANEGLNLDKIADEVEQDLKEQEEEDMIQKVNNVSTDGVLTTTSISYDDVLRTNIKAVLHSDMKEDSKVNVIIGLCKQQEIMGTSTYYKPYPFEPQVVYTSQKE